MGKLNTRHSYFRCCIYFIRYRSDLPIKIGYTKSWVSRKEQINTFAPYPVQVIKIIRGTPFLEKSIHKLFSRYRTQGEWFETNVQLLKFIDLCPEDDVFQLEKLIKTYKLDNIQSKQEEAKELNELIVPSLKPTIKCILRKKIP